MVNVCISVYPGGITASIVDENGHFANNLIDFPGSAGKTVSSLEEAYEFVKGLPKTGKIVVWDCCFAGGMYRIQHNSSPFASGWQLEKIVTREELLEWAFKKSIKTAFACCQHS